MSNAGIYIITSPTNKIYVGQSVDLKSRYGYYKYNRASRQMRIHNSIQKYGWDAHKFEVILYLDKNTKQHIINYWEQFFIDFYRNQGYELLNIRGAGSRGKHSEESKIKQSLSMKGKSKGTVSEFHKKQISIGKMGIAPSEEHKKQISETHRNKNKPQYKEYQKNRLVGKCWNHSPEIKKQLSETFHSTHKHLFKLTPEKVLIIFNHILENKLTYQEIAKMFNVHPITISSIKFGKTWGSVTGLKKQNHGTHLYL